jgi:site-specific DNA recombinase
MGCTAHHLKACSNQRRVTRQDLERVVLEGLTDRIAQPQVINWFIPEYVNERGPASAEADDRHERAVQRLAEVGREIANVMTQVKSGAKGYAAQLLNDNLESLGAEKERLDRTVRAGPDEAPPPLTPDTLLARVRGLLSGLGEALEGDERDATRAKDIIRSLITKVTITPLEPDGRRPDGRGAGAVRVQVEGEISRLVDHAMLDRKIMHKRGATPTHDLPIATFTFYVDLTRDHSETQEGLWADVAVVGRLLDDAEYPVLYQRMIAAMNDRGRPITAEEEVVDERRARIALAQLRRDQWARAVRIGGTHGWVWDEPDISDDEWRERYDRRVDDKTPIGTFRISPPEAYVVVIGSKVG